MNKLVIFYAGIVKVIINNKLVKMHYEFSNDKAFYIKNGYKVIVRR